MNVGETLNDISKVVEARTKDVRVVTPMGEQVVDPGTLFEPRDVTPKDSNIEVVTCKICGVDYGMRPQTVVVSSSIDCPYCAESQPHIKHVNGFKLPNMQEMETIEDDMGLYSCDECGDQIHTSHLPLTICNICLAKEDDTDEINWPKHYNAGKIQPIDAIEDWKLDFRLANAVKYIARHEHKGNAKKDLEKAIWYIQRFIDKELTKEGNDGQN